MDHWPADALSGVQASQGEQLEHKSLLECLVYYFSRLLGLAWYCFLPGQLMYETKIKSEAEMLVTYLNYALTLDEMAMFSQENAEYDRRVPHCSPSPLHTGRPDWGWGLRRQPV